MQRNELRLLSLWAFVNDSLPFNEEMCPWRQNVEFGFAFVTSFLQRISLKRKLKRNLLASADDATCPNAAT